jgi:flavin-dependent dehydrogenase
MAKKRAPKKTTQPTRRSAPPIVEPHDVAVLGGGVAGAVAARLLAAWGRRVILLTRPAAPHALAESLPPSCEKLLSRAGILNTVNAAGFVRFTGHTVKWGDEPVRTELFQGRAKGWQVSRDVLDKLLLREAATAGVEVHAKAVVRAVTLDAGLRPHRIRFDEGARKREVAARWVLDCTGRAGPLILRGARVLHHNARTLAIVATWERKGGWTLDDPTHTIVESYDGGWAWSVPISPTKRQITVMIDPGRTVVASGTRLASTYRSELARTTLCVELTKGAKLAGRPWAREASSYESARVTAHRALLVGDAASFADPLSSFGVKKALASAWLAAVVTRSALEDPARALPGLGLFELRERAMAVAIRHDLQLLARSAAAAHAGGFWGDRNGTDADGAAHDLDLLRGDMEVRRAHEEIRRRPHFTVRPAAGARRVSHPMIEDDLIVVRNHFVLSGLPTPVRYIRNVDLVALADLAPDHSDVPELYAKYRKAGGGGELPDMVGALAVLVAKGALRFS